MDVVELHAFFEDAVLLHRREAVGMVFDSYARYWMESFRLPARHPALVEDGFAVEGYGRIQGARQRAAGSSWCSLASRRLGVGGVLARRVQGPAGLRRWSSRFEPPELAEWFVGLRRGHRHQRRDPRTVGGDRGCARALQGDHILCLLCDRDLGAGWWWRSSSSGSVTTLPGGPATLALRSGAPLLPTVWFYLSRRAYGHLGLVRPPARPSSSGRGKLREDVGRITEDLAHELEADPPAAPEQWHLMQPNWPL